MDKSTTIRIKIHQILTTREFYFLPMHKIKQIMILLKLRPAFEPKEIQANVIQAFVKITDQQKSSATYLIDISNYFDQIQFRQIPKQTKEYVTSIIKDIIEDTIPITNQQLTNSPFNFSFFNYYMMKDVYCLPPTQPNYGLPAMPYINYQNMQINQYQPQLLLRNTPNRTMVSAIWGQDRIHGKDNNQHSGKIEPHLQCNDKKTINNASNQQSYKGDKSQQIYKINNQQISKNMKKSKDELDEQYLPRKSYKRSKVKKSDNFSEQPPQLELKYENSISKLDYRHQVGMGIDREVHTDPNDIEVVKPSEDERLAEILCGQQHQEKYPYPSIVLQQVNQNFNKRDTDQIISENHQHLNLSNQNQALQESQLKYKPQSCNQVNDSIEPIEPIPEVLFANCPCRGGYQGQKAKCLLCCNMYHLHCLSINDLIKQIQCPKCKIKIIDPLTVTKTVLGEYYLQNINSQKFETILNLSEYEYLDSKEYRHTNRINEIQMRCIKLPTSNEVNEVSWPDQLQIYVNNIRISTIYSLSVTSLLKKRKDGPLVITSASFKFKTEDDENPEKVKIRLEIVRLPPAELVKKRINNQFTFLFGIYFTEKVKPEVLYQTIKSNIQPCNKNFIHSLMEMAEESEEIDIEKEQFTITDAYTGSIINLPVRGIFCRHSQCFDLETHIIFMSAIKVRNWRCPICGKQAKKFTVDYQIQEIITNLSAKNIIPNRIAMIKNGDTILKVNIQSSEEQEHKKKLIKKKKNVFRSRHIQPGYSEHVYSELMKKIQDEIGIEKYLTKEEQQERQFIEK